MAAPCPAAEPADETLRQLERQQELRDRLEAAPDVRVPTRREAIPALPAAEKPCVIIKRIRIAGTMPARFDRVLGQALSRLDWSAPHCLGETGIRIIQRMTQQVLIDAGLITTRVEIPPQDLRDGKLTIAFLPGRVGSIRPGPDADDRARPGLAFPARPGDLLNLRAIEQGLENLESLPSVAADITVEPGDRPGESDVVVDWQQDFPLQLTLSVDDSGSRETGRFLGTVTLSGDHLFGLNGRLYGSLTSNLPTHQLDRPGGTRSHTFHYSLPLGYWRLGFTASRFTYHQTIAGLARNHRYSGQGKRRELDISRVVHRSATSRTRLTASAWLQTYSNAIDETPITIQDRRMAGYSLSVRHRHFFGTSRLTLALTHRWGTGMLGARPAPEEAFGEGTSRPRITSLNVRLDAPFTVGDRSLRYRGEIRAQYNHTRLIPQDRFAIGSRYSVRGFGGELLLSGDRGAFWRNELHLNLPGPLHPYIALDAGRVGGAAAHYLPGRHLAGAAFGLQWHWKDAWLNAWAARAVKRPSAYPDPGLQAGFRAGIRL